MLITEELFLLLRRDDGKRENAWAYNGYGLAAAVLTDLVIAERVTVSDDKDPAVTVTSHAPTGNPVLDHALAAVADKSGKPLSEVVAYGGLDVEGTVADSLANLGIVRIEDKRMLGLVPEKYPIVDAEPERKVRARLRSVLGGAHPTLEDSVLLSILQGIDVAPGVLAEEKGSMSNKELKARIEEVSTEAVAGHAAAHAVQQAVSSMNAAVFTAVFVPIIVSGG